MSRRFRNMRRIPERGVIAGVCAGIAEYFDWNVRLLRAILVVAVLCTGVFPFVLVYGVLWYVMEPAAPDFARATDGPAGGGSPGRPATMSEVKARFERLDQRLRNIEECVTDRDFELRRELKKLET